MSNLLNPIINLTRNKKMFESQSPIMLGAGVAVVVGAIGSLVAICRLRAQRAQSNRALPGENQARPEVSSPLLYGGQRLYDTMLEPGQPPSPKRTNEPTNAKEAQIDVEAGMGKHEVAYQPPSPTSSNGSDSGEPPIDFMLGRQKAEKDEKATKSHSPQPISPTSSIGSNSAAALSEYAKKPAQSENADKMSESQVSTQSLSSTTSTLTTKPEIMTPAKDTHALFSVSPLQSQQANDRSRITSRHDLKVCFQRFVEKVEGNTEISGALADIYETTLADSLSFSEVINRECCGSEEEEGDIASALKTLIQTFNEEEESEEGEIASALKTLIQTFYEVEEETSPGDGNPTVCHALLEAVYMQILERAGIETSHTLSKHHSSSLVLDQLLHQQ